MRNNFLRKIEAHLRKILDPQIEQRILSTICSGKGADIGCGSNKVTKDCIGIDIFGKEEIGLAGCEKGKSSVADYKSSGDNLSMFKDGELDFIVAKHNLEHYTNPIKTLLEWKRVLKTGGKLGIIVPDHKYVITEELDPTHYSAFTLETLEALFKFCGFKIIDKGEAIKHWSIYLVAEK